MRCALGLAIGLLTSSLIADTYLANNTFDARQYLENAQDGDTVLLAPGEYDNLTIEGRTGVTLRSQFASNPAVIVPAGDPSPALYIGHPQNVTVSDIVIDYTRAGSTTGYGINVDAQEQPTFGDGLVLRNVTIKQTAPAANIDGIHMSGVRNFVIEGCTLENWGTGGSGMDVVGAYSGIIRNNHLSGASVSTGAGIQMKGGAREITVRSNRLNNAGNRAICFGGYTDIEYFEPGIRFEAKDLIAEGNVIVGGYSPIAYASSVGGEFRHNFSYQTSRWLGRILVEGQEAAGFPTYVSGGKYIDNRLVWTGDLPEYVNYSDETYEDFTFANNQWYRIDAPADSEPWWPVGLSETGGVYGQNPGLDPDQVVPWKFAWGVWLVNASQAQRTFNPNGLFPEALYLAIPGEGAIFDLSLPMPLVGNWTYELINDEVSLRPMADGVLIRESLVPEPVAGLTMAMTLALSMVLRPARRCAR